MEDEFWLAFSMIEGLNPKKKLDLINKYKTPEIILNLTKEELIEENSDENICDYILNKKYNEKVDKYLEYMNKYNIRLINIYNSNYPNILKNIYDAPVVLFALGNLELLNKSCIAMVGCRDCTEYGRKVALSISYKLAKKGYVVVSGLAKGIDACSHMGAINAKGYTIAVLGSGVDVVYPKENKSLYESILKNNGLIISEYLVGTKPLKENFPARNRIISGISESVIVVEAKEKSGSLITAEFALEQGKDVYAVPR